MKFWKALSFKAKTLISLGGVLLIMIAALGLSFVSSSNMRAEYLHIIKSELEARDQLRVLSEDMLTARRHEKDFLLRGDEKYLKKNAETVEDFRAGVEKLKNSEGFDFSKEEYGSLVSSIDVYEKGFAKAVDAIKSQGDSSTGLRGELRNIAHEIEKFIKANNIGDKGFVQLLTLRRHEKDYLLRYDLKYFEKAKVVTGEMKKLASDPAIGDQLNVLAEKYIKKFGEVTEAHKTQVDSIASFRSAIHSIEKFIKEHIKEINEEIANEVVNIEKRQNLIEMIMLGSSVFAILILLGVTIFYFRTAQAITELALSLKHTSDETSSSSRELKQTADDLSSSVTEQSAAVLETVSTLDEIREMMKRSVDNAAFSEQKSTESHGVASEGKEAVSNVVKAINEISDCNNDITGQMEKTSTELEQIVNVIKEISDKTKVINDIVFQTKLLSFNASVEAARAGEHGKGFAVVAEEVGNLAQMSGNASKEIETLISSSVHRVESIVTESKEAVGRLVSVAKGKTEYGVETAQRCDQVLNEVVSNVAQVKDLMKEISGAASEQATGVENIASAMNQLDQVTHVNTTIASQTAMNSSTLAKQAIDLDLIVSTLESLINGQKSNKVVGAKNTIAESQEKGKVVEMKKAEKNLSIVEDIPINEDAPVSKVSGENFMDGPPSRDDDRFEDV
ncbi:methyl-accepting chemotaxis protein [Bacteriovorax sp. Seq25_V]|uniref:methyl-accepting chemotaxis protein n=1 Tax=Bacteriovorax sp. Seq25_V TaxID=1201288 RepID=UPI00038A24E4|nr:methyl-accepting chemotaxis protein [Bacteriovorax sp. Seq25_V]EQC47600.1 methyl-accepting chemotaxis protein signaling domain protein [Bacteriovorax sp. Seq25_V]